MFRRLDIDLAAPAAVRELVQYIAAHGFPRGVRSEQAPDCALAALRLEDGSHVEIRTFPGPGGIACYTRRSPGRQCFDTACALRDGGLPVPEPFAWIERRSRTGRLLESHYVSNQPQGFAAAASIGTDSPGADVMQLAAECGRLIHRMHAAGFCHPGRLLFKAGGDVRGRVIRLNIPDVQTVRKLPRQGGKPLEDIACLFIEETPVLEAARTYAAQGGLDSDELESRVLGLMNSSHEKMLP